LLDPEVKFVGILAPAVFSSIATHVPPDLILPAVQAGCSAMHAPAEEEPGALQRPGLQSVHTLVPVSD